MVIEPLALQLGGQAPLLSLVVGVAAIVFFLLVLDLPPFVALVLAGISVGIVAPSIAFAEIPGQFATAFGEGMAGIGIPILMAAVIGKSMIESGAADRIVRGFTGVVGRDRIEISLFSSSFVIAIPVFFDNVFYLLAPLARAARSRTGSNYTLFIVVVGAAGAVTHGFVPPTPGPLLAANQLGANVGATILIGLLTGVPTAIVAGLGYGYWINRRLDIPLRDAMGTTVDEVQAKVETPTSALPGLFESLLPILLAILLVGANTFVETFVGEDSAAASVTGFFGDPNLALTVAALVAAYTFHRMSEFTDETFSDELTDALQSGGNIAAITAAGGAFGAMLAEAGVGDYIAGGLEDVGLGLLVTAWIIAAGVRIVQGSATVAIVTTAGIMAPFTAELAVNTAYLVMVIGAGATFCSWYNDSGFWIVKEIGGLTQSETLKTWTVATVLIGIVGLLSTLIISSVLPFA